MNLCAYHCLAESDTIHAALIKIDKLDGELQVLFVLNKSKQVVGTLTDGDIRRALIKGYTLSEPVDSIMNQNFKYLTRTEKDYTQRRFFWDAFSWKKLQPLIEEKKEGAEDVK